MKRSRVKRLALLLVPAVALVVAACGGDDDGGPAPTTAPQASPTPRATATARPTATPRPAATARPTDTPRATSAPTSAPADGAKADAGKQVFQRAGCTACHTVAGVPGATGQVGPELNGVATRAGTRVSGLSAVEYLRQSITTPDAFVVPNFSPVMPANLAQGADLDNLVAFLLTLK